jgi:Skp family chaperone for outer membrane proteins
VNLVFDTSGNTLNGVPFILNFPSGADMSPRLTTALQGSQPGMFEATRGLRIGVVNMNDIFRSARKTKEAEAKINADKETAKKEYDRRAADYKKESDRITSLSGAAREKALAKLRTAEQEIKNFVAGKEKELTEQAEVVRRQIVDEIVSALRAAVKGESSALIFDVSGEGSKGVPLLVIKGQLPDLSAEIVATINGGSARPASAPSLASTSALRVACADMRRAAAALPAEDSLAAIQFVERVRRIAATEKFDLVLDSSGLSASGVPLLLSVREIPDLTDKIVNAKVP